MWVATVGLRLARTGRPSGRGGRLSLPGTVVTDACLNSKVLAPGAHPERKAQGRSRRARGALGNAWGTSTPRSGHGSTPVGAVSGRAPTGVRLWLDSADAVRQEAEQLIDGHVQLPPWFTVKPKVVD